MRLLIEFFHTEYKNSHEKMREREAVRGIIIEQKKVLMIHSQVTGEYKFPGGGIDFKESHEEALTREVREETGAIVSDIEKKFGMVIDRGLPTKTGYVKTTSYYYICHVTNEQLGKQELDKGEKLLEYKPVWVDINKAIQGNKALLAQRFEPCPIIRETYVLEQIQKERE